MRRLRFCFRGPRSFGPCLCALILCYWSMVIVGFLGVDLIPFDIDADGALEGGADGAVDGALEGGAEGALRVEPRAQQMEP